MVKWLRTNFEKLKANRGAILHAGPFTHVYWFFGGLCEFYAAILIAATIYFELRGKLEPSFAAAVTAICGILAIHDALDDRLPPIAPVIAQVQSQATSVVNDITVDAAPVAPAAK